MVMQVVTEGCTDPFQPQNVLRPRVNAEPYHMRWYLRGRGIFGQDVRNGVGREIMIILHDNSVIRTFESSAMRSRV